MRPAHLLGIASALLATAASAAAQDELEAGAQAGSGAALEDEPGAAAQAGSEDDLVLYGEGVGQYRLRASFMNEIPLSPPVPGTVPADTDELGQEFWVSQWFRVRLELGVRDRIRLVGEADAFEGLVVGQFTQGVEAARRAREKATAFPGVQARALFLEWIDESYRVQGGLVPVHWGLGIFDNDAAHEPPFGDYRYGDVVTRLALTARPWGADSPVHLGVAGDLVYEDQRAQIRDDDTAWRGVLAAAYQKDERRLGVLGVYRHQRSDVERGGRQVADLTDEVTLDVYARWDVEDPSGGEVFGALEAAYTHSELRLGGPVSRTDSGRDLLAVVGQLGRTSGSVDVVFELGYASDGGLDRAVIHPDHQVGLLLFPEVVAWQTARAATLLERLVIEGPVPAGTPLAPTEGGVAGAVYLFPTVTWRIASFLRLRLGAVWAHAVADVVDPYRLGAEGTRANYRGGDPDNRDLGLELDGQLHAQGELSPGVVLSGGLEGAWLLPGHAFDDAAGDTLDPLGLFRVRLGLTF